MNYSEMSDFSINKAVAEAQGYDTKITQFFGLQGLSKVRTTERHFDYCESWTDAGPIIAENKISLNFDADGYEPPRYAWCKASSPCGKVYYGGESQPLRAAMIVFLMMQEDSCAN